MSIRNAAINRILQGTPLYGRLDAREKRTLRRMLDDAYRSGQRHDAEKAAHAEPGPPRDKHYFDVAPDGRLR